MAIGQEAHIAGTAEFEAADRSLKKTMGFQHLLFLSVTAIIGSGWLLAALAAAAVAGPAAIISWVIGGIFVIFISLTYAEVAGMLPRSGGIVRYPHLTHGAYTGWLIGWTYWLSAITVPAIEAEAVVTYVGSQFPSSGILVTKSGVPEMQWPKGILFGIGLMALFFVLNFFGIRLLSEANRWVTWWKIIIPSLTAIFLFTIAHGANFSSLSYHGQGGFAPYGTSAIFEALSTTGIIFSYLGFRQALDYAGEARNPQRHVPMATIFSVVIGMVIYVGLQIGFIGAVHWNVAGVHIGDWAGLSSSSWASSPLVSALRAAGVGWLATYAWILLVDAGISPSATGWVYLGTSTRTNYGLSVNGLLPKALQWPNRWGIPWVSAVIAAVIGCIFFIPAPSWYTLVGFITSTTALTYIMGGVGLPVLRRYAPNLARPFRLRWMWLWSPVGFLAAMMIVYWSTYKTLTSVYGTVFIGLPIFVWYYAPTRGWFTSALNRNLAIALGFVYLGAWVYIQDMGGWLLRVTPPASGSWGFLVYWIAQSADILFFCAVLWLLTKRPGRRHVESCMWLICMLIAVLPVSYYGQFGPEKVPAIQFPWGTLIAVGIGIIAFAWGVASGLNTDELQEITSASSPGPPGPGTPAAAPEEPAQETGPEPGEAAA
ncbi:MAG: APC family permease [Streptosporangiaceae bacterium]